jgi:hypothetical protein
MPHFYDITSIESLDDAVYRHNSVRFDKHVTGTVCHCPFEMGKNFTIVIT